MDMDVRIVNRPVVCQTNQRYEAQLARVIGLVETGDSLQGSCNPTYRYGRAPEVRKGCNMRIFLAGATGAIGRPLVHQLVERGHTVFGTTQTSSKTGDLQSLGATPVLLDGLDRDAVIRAIGAARPEVVIHQMTALTAKADFKHFDRWFALTNALRTRGCHRIGNIA